MKQHQKSDTHSKMEIKKFLAQAMTNYSRGDADSLKRCCANFTNLRKDWEFFRDEHHSKAPDVIIYHFVQMLALHGLAKKLPREADRFKLILNLSIQQQWNEDLKQIFLNTVFQPMKGAKQIIPEDRRPFIDRINSVIRLILHNSSFEHILSAIFSLEDMLLNYFTLYHENDTIVLITYDKNKSKNQVLHRFVYINNTVYIYKNAKSPEFEYTFDDATQAITQIESPANTNSDDIIETEQLNFGTNDIPSIFGIEFPDDDFQEYMASLLS